MKITIESNLKIKDMFEPPVEMELGPDKNELRDVLQLLSDTYRPLRFIEEGEMGDDLHHLYLNGESHFSFPQGLKKKVKEGDTVLVEAYLEPLDGH